MMPGRSKSEKWGAQKAAASAGFAVCLTLMFLLSARLESQTSATPSLVTLPINESKWSRLKGNTHPLARSEYDRGAAPDSLPMDHMQLVLKRASRQQAALEELLAQQHDRTS